MEYEIREYLDGAIRITYARTTLLLTLFILLMKKGTLYSVYRIYEGKLIYLYETRK